MRKILSFSLILFIVDQIIKLIVKVNIDLNGSILVLNDFFYLSHVHNYGAAFSILYGNRIFLILFSIFSLILIYMFFIKNNKLNKLDYIIYSLLYGGIVGNLFDRIVYGYVIDYLDFYIFNYNFPVFNFADVCIVISVILIIFDSIRGVLYENRSKK